MGFPPAMAGRSVAVLVWVVVAVVLMGSLSLSLSRVRQTSMHVVPLSDVVVAAKRKPKAAKSPALLSGDNRRIVASSSGAVDWSVTLLSANSVSFTVRRARSQLL